MTDEAAIELARICSWEWRLVDAVRAGDLLIDDGKPGEWRAHDAPRPIGYEVLIVIAVIVDDSDARYPLARIIARGARSGRYRRRTLSVCEHLEAVKIDRCRP